MGRIILVFLWFKYEEMNHTFKVLLITGGCKELGESAFSCKPAGMQHIHCNCTDPGAGEQVEKGIAEGLPVFYGDVKIWE